MKVTGGSACAMALLRPARDDVSPGSDVVRAPLGLYTGPSLKFWV
ncbi:Cytochrome c heme lyase subunit CcmH [Methylorubrum populi]|uniref:Cytochrome c heme lyase subunit CcmH n=1 Tax=Methylorubrum populi TaxID=223967 RepID=A0A833J905_9HYPH|nr:Cytochrome c heme lyase subunit CcmH [Methylorubrum populi]